MLCLPSVEFRRIQGPVPVSHALSFCRNVPHSFKDTWPRLGMPAFDSAIELRASVEDAVVVFLVMDGSRDAVAKHTLRQARQRIDRIFAQE